MGGDPYLSDPLIRGHITRDPVNDEPIFRRFDYYVGDVVLELRGTDGDFDAVLTAYPELTRDDLHAALRFWELHGNELRDYLS